MARYCEVHRHPLGAGLAAQDKPGCACAAAVLRTWQCQTNPTCRPGSPGWESECAKRTQSGGRVPRVGDRRMANEPNLRVRRPTVANPRMANEANLGVRRPGAGNPTMANEANVRGWQPRSWEAEKGERTQYCGFWGRERGSGRETKPAEARRGRLVRVCCVLAAGRCQAGCGRVVWSWRFSGGRVRPGRVR